MARAWLVDGKVIAKKVKNATLSSAHQSKEVGVNRECPKCKHHIDNSDVSVEWPGLPAGVKFDPSDLELVEHLAGRVGLGRSKSHPLIDEFIPTLEENEGICYTHPENLPGVKKDGNSIHYFHRTSNAYSTGCRKRRRIQLKHGLSEDHVRWHKTGKTRPIIDNGVQKGCKKIMVLYKSLKKSKPDKTNWVMHQYHLGTEEDEKDGEFVVSKIFYQQQQPFQNENNEALDVELGTRSNSAETDSPHNRADPSTPLTQTPDQPKPRTAHPHTECNEDASPQMMTQNARFEPVGSHYSSLNDGDELVNPALLADELPSVTELDGADLDASLLCYEVLDGFNPQEELGLEQFQCHGDSNLRNDMFGGDSCTFPEIPDLDDIDINNPPDFNLSDLQFGSQDSILSWIDRL